jgi:response regulator NasT
MQLQERVYSILLVSASESFNESLLSLLAESAFEPVKTVSGVSAAKRELSERGYDFIIVNAPLPDDPGVRFAIDACGTDRSVVLLLVRSELHMEIGEKVIPHGVFVLQKPISKPMMRTALFWLASARERLRKAEKKTLTIEEKMAEIRLVNRAKWILIEQEHMSEADAHRFIEKQAMDRCVSRRVIAEAILQNRT